ncbi:MAG: T9SS type A sorting domain-containing protein, partial [Candidatus Marinimicrobia bacterium]|nr:T9SS type A sorting domain-containing protein [Candidatus Neomarinimicrobiota bacterium]
GNYATGDPRDALVLNLTGTLAAGDVYVVARTEADAAVVAVADITFEYSNTVAGAYTVCFTGNDALGLFLNGVLVDAIGDPSIGTNFNVAGVSGATADHTLIRKSTVEAGNINWTTSAGTDESNSEWVVLAQDSFSDLGSHTSGPVAYTISNVSVDTAFPQAGSEISISVDITPDEGVSAPTTVKIFYGTGGTQTNQTDMWLESGTTYEGIIPALSSGNIVLDYYISAIGTETINSNLYSMIVAGTIINISDIHANIGSYAGMTKTIEGVITIGDSVLSEGWTSVYIQDASGRGMNLYKSGEVLADLERGTRVKVVGEVALFGSTVEIKDFSYHVVSTGQSLPTPLAVNVAGANSANIEGTLATVTGTLSKIESYTGGKNLVLSEGTDSIAIRVWNTTGINTDNYTIGTEYAVTGVGNLDSYASEYQILVGYQSDITDDVAICDDCTPETFALNKAYPNPFNPMTTIEFNLDEASDFSISVFNITGQRVDVLSSGYAEPGLYKQIWNAGDFTSGVYFIRLEAGMKVATQKVVLIK